MPFSDCIRSAQQQGALSPEEADDLIRRYEVLRENARGTTAPDGAEGEARRLLSAQLTSDAVRKERLAALAGEATDRLGGFARGFRNASGRPDVLTAFAGVIENRNNALIGEASVVGQHQALMGYATARLDGLMAANERKYFSLRSADRSDRLLMDNLLRENYGEATGDAAAQAYLAAWHALNGELVDMFNAAGGDVAKLERYLPQRHDARAISAAGPQAWADFIAPLLDTAKMTDPLTGGPLSPARLRESLAAVYDRLVTDGAIDRTPSRQPTGRGALANQRQEHRFLIFKDAASWKAYNVAFGGNDLYAAMTDHIQGLTRDIAALRVLGPNPNATVTWMKQVVQQEAAKAKLGQPSLFNSRSEGMDAMRRLIGKEARANDAGGKLPQLTSGRIGDGADYLDRLWEAVNGAPAGGNQNAADLVAALRNVLMADQLAGAAVTAVVGDPFQTKVASTFAGIPAARWLADLPRQIFSGASKQDIYRAGVVMEDAFQNLRADLRGWSWQQRAREITRRMPERVFEWTGLTPWTNVNRRANATSFMFHAGDLADKPLAAIEKGAVNDQRFARWLRGFAIDEAAWDKLRAVPALAHGEAGGMLRPADVMDAARAAGDQALFDIGLRYSEALHAFIEEAVPTGTARTRVALGRVTTPGTVTGELLRSTTSYISYGTTVLTSLMRATQLEVANGALRGAGYLASALITLTIGGALQQQLLELRNGRDPKDMTSLEFWLVAMAKGGGLGFYGDYITADYQRGSSATAARVAGPVVGAIVDALSLLNVKGMAADEEPNRGRLAVGLARKYTPLTTMWMVKPAVDRILFDRLQLLADPTAYRAWRRRERQLQQQGQGLWWKAGAALPARAPDWANAINR